MSRFNWIQKAWTEVIALWRRSKLWTLHVFALAWARVRWIRIGWTEFVGHWRRGKLWVLRVLAFVWARVRQFAWLLVLATVLLIVWLTLRHWDWLSNVGNDLWGWLGSTPSGQDREETNSTTLRNIGLVIAGAIALPLALWRSFVAQRQAQIAQRDLLNDRYQKGTEMLGNDVLSVRLGGIYALQYLAEEHPEQYHVQIMRLFCTFVRRPVAYAAPVVDQKEDDIARSIDEGQQVSSAQLREDVQAAITAIGTRSAEDITIEKRSNYVPNLHGANLSCAHLSGANLSGVNLSNAILHRANFFDLPLQAPDLSEPLPSGPGQPQARVVITGEFVTPDLSGFENRQANLSGSNLRDADLSNARLLGADLSGAQLWGANFTGANIIYANLFKAVLIHANLSDLLLSHVNLSGAMLGFADLSGAHLAGAKLYGANLFGTCLQGTDLSYAVLSKENGKYIATGLTQAQIDKANVELDNPPSLTGIVDYETKDPLFWRGKPLGDEA